MRMRFVAAGLVIVSALGGGSAFAQHSSSQPSQHCDGTTPGDFNHPPPAKVKIDLAKPGVCFNLTGGFKGAAWVDFASMSIVVDGDSTNYSTNRCFDGYAGVRASEQPTLLWSQGDNYDPNAAPRDGGTNGHGPGSPNDSFDPSTEQSEVQNCFFG